MPPPGVTTNATLARSRLGTSPPPGSWRPRRVAVLAPRLPAPYPSPMSRLLPPLLACLLAGCLGVDDTHSGTFRQPVPDDGQVEQLVAFDLFHFGDYVQGILRYYTPRPDDPFGDESRCTWTKASTLADDGTFELVLEDPIAQSRFGGRLEGDGASLIARIDSAGESSTDVLLNRTSLEPDSTCTTVAPRLMVADFEGLSRANEFPPDGYEIEQPVFGVQWLGVEAVRSGGATVFVGLNPRVDTWAPLHANVTQNGRGLRGELAFNLSPPDEEFLTYSGVTRYTLGHFLAVDIGADAETFDQKIDDEVIFASGVRLGTRPDAPDGLEHDGFGRAVLFVEGSLAELDPSLLDLMDNIESVPPDDHFYVVDLFSEGDRVQWMRFDHNAATRNDILVAVTDDFLNATSMPLPRLFPRN